jgi:signal transduction histidine kinase/CheY-like chemotaxis protein
MLDFFSKLFSNDFMPHRMCFLGDSTVTWLHVVSDCSIALAYYLIPVLLFRFAQRRRDVSFQWIFLAFGMFILACGSTHMLGAITVFNPMYRLEGAVKALTAVASIATLALLVPIVPKLIALPSPSQLTAEVEERRRAENEVRRINEELEQRVARRTASLEQALTNLRTEMERREDLEGQLLQSQKMEAVGRLAGGVAHDFNNLLTIILGYADMLGPHIENDPAAAGCVHEIREAAERASGLTNQLLAFSRRQVTAPRVLDLNQSLLRLEKMLRRIIGEDVELQLNLAEGLAPVMADPSQVDQVVMNLAVNSRDAMPGGGRLTIQTGNVFLDEQYAANHLGTAPGKYVSVAVADTGTGMDEATKTRVFEPFFTTKEPGKGTGLGLSIVYGIVKQNGGDILVESQPGGGTVFRIHLPAATGAPEGPRAAIEPAEAEGAGDTILLVEDDHALRRLARTVLAKRGYHVLDSGSPADALALIRSRNGKVDLLLTDLIMPKMNGIELAAQILGEYPGVRTLFMSGYTETSAMREGAVKPNMHYLRKPFTAAELRNKVREVLGRSRMEGR